MVGAQREATRPRRPRTGWARATSPRTAARLLLPWALLTPLVAQAGSAPSARPDEQANQPDKVATPATTAKGPEPGPSPDARVADPAPSRTGSGGRPREPGAHDREDDRPAIAPPAFAPAPAATPVAPPERPVLPVRKPAGPPETPPRVPEETTPPREPVADTAEELAETAAQLAATAAKLAATAARLAAKAAARARAAKLGQVAPAERPATPAPATPAAAPPALAAAGRTSEPNAGTAAAAADRPDVATLDQAVLDHIRLEIKGRLPYFQACADAARRRGSQEVRRVQATWTIAADGSIKEMKIEGVPDPLLVTCITRMGSHPFEIKPGTELTIPTPIVFVR
jgi:hypothetical protein